MEQNFGIVGKPQLSLILKWKIFEKKKIKVKINKYENFQLLKAHPETMCLKCVENKVSKWLFITFKTIQKQPPQVFYKKAVLLKTSQYSQDEHENTCVGVSF